VIIQCHLFFIHAAIPNSVSSWSFTQNLSYAFDYGPLKTNIIDWNSVSWTTIGLTDVEHREEEAFSSQVK